MHSFRGESRIVSTSEPPPVSLDIVVPHAGLAQISMFDSDHIARLDMIVARLVNRSTTVGIFIPHVAFGMLDSQLDGDLSDGDREFIKHRLVTYNPPPDGISTTALDSYKFGEFPLGGDFIMCASLLQKLSSTRQSISDTMVFCMDRSCSARAVLSVIMSFQPSSADSEIGRLYLLSDILYNTSCSAKNAWVYRSFVDDSLPQLFCHLNHCVSTYTIDLKHSLSERLTSAVSTVLAAWKRSVLFSDEILCGFWFQFAHTRDSVIAMAPKLLSPDDSILRADMKSYGLQFHGDGFDHVVVEQFGYNMLGVVDDIDGDPWDETDDLQLMRDVIRTNVREEEVCCQEEDPSQDKSSMKHDWSDISFHLASVPRAHSTSNSVSDTGGHYKSSGEIRKVENIDSLFIPNPDALRPVIDRSRSREDRRRRERRKRDEVIVRRRR